jgi:glycosyltransferase involved in cell wall biosynthesis
MTSGWALRRRRAAKQFLWLVGQRRAFGDASLIHATSDLELDDVRRLGYGGPVAIVPNGVDVPTRRVRPGANRRRRIVSFGRLHEAKGNDVLLRAWAMLEGALTDWDLVIAGPDDGELPALQRLARDFGLERVEFQGPCYGEKRDALLAAADLLVLASRSENFGLVVAEALAAGTPVVTTRQTPWQALTRIGAGWWVEGTQGGLRDAIVEAAALSRTELAARGERGRVWVERELSWPVVAARMLRAYRWVRDGGPPPTDIDPGSRSWRVRWRLP